MTTLLYLSFPDIVQIGEANKQLEHTRKLTVEAGMAIVNTNHVAYDVEPYYVVNGLPEADTSLGINADCIVESGDLAASGAYPKPYTVELEPDPTSRWLPLSGTFDDLQRWAPFQGVNRIELDANGTSPTLDDAYEYLLGRAFATGPAMRMDGGDYFQSDEIQWSSSSVTVALVAVLRTPMLDFYGLLETYPIGDYDPERPYISLRYNRNGSVECHIQGMASIRQTASQGIRTGQPIIVVLRVSNTTRTVSVVVVDRSLTQFDTKTVKPHPTDARLYVGRSPATEYATADMDALEVSYWTDMSTADMLAMINQLDRLYGVSR